MGLVRERMSSYTIRSKKLMDKGKIKDAMDLTIKGLEYYSKRIIGSLTPYSTADAGMLVLVLRHIANEIAADNEGAEAYAEQMAKALKMPKLKETEKVQKPNRR